MRTWLLLDCDYLCHRAFYSTGTLKFGDVLTGVVFGFLRDIVNFQQLFQTDDIAFCFDHGKSLRVLEYPRYKSNRQQVEGTSEFNAKKELAFQIKQLRLDYLPSIGFRNVFWQNGYEADDVIASVCKNLTKRESAVVISADHDLYQLLTDRVIIFNPHKKQTVTVKTFEDEWGLSPTQWVDIKSIAGCQTDCIAGVQGVGEKTAAKFITGSLKTSAKAFNAIVKGNAVWKRNRYLVQLPYPGTDRFELEDDKIKREDWTELTTRLGMKSLCNEFPRCAH